MSSWAAIVDSTASGAGSKRHSSPKEITDVQCMNINDYNAQIPKGKQMENAGQPGRSRSGSQGSKNRKARRGRKGGPQKDSLTNSEEKPQKSPTSASSQGSDVRVGKARAVFAVPPPNAWQAAADTKERICANIVHSEKKLNQDDAEALLEVDVANFQQQVNLSSDGDIPDKVTGESSRASLTLLSENSYSKILGGQEGRLYSVSPKGIRNPGNVCFANSVIQTLLGIEPFCQIVYHIGNANSLLDPSAFPVLKSLSNIAKEMQFFDSHEKLVEPMSRRKGTATIDVALVVALIHESFKIRYKGDQKLRQVEQEDAHEFLHCLLDALHQELLQLQDSSHQHVSMSHQQDTPTMHDDGDEWLTQTGKRAVKQQIVTTEAVKKTSTLITELFEGMQSTCISSRGNPPSVTMHPFLVVEIPLYDPNIETLEGAIDILTATETISGYRPRGQDQACDASKAEKFNSLPTILAFHLMRFQFTGSTEKLQRCIKYDGRLKIKPSWLMPSSKDRHAEYELKATISHHGQSIARGHFTANVKHQGTWLHFNDEIIHGITLPKVYQDAPYLLLYERKV